MRLALGTAQFGLDYGITNTAGQVSKSEIEKILELAAHKGIRLLDTSVQYGNSESILGEVLQGDSAFQFISKSPKFSADESDWSNELSDSFASSLAALGSKQFYAYLFHNGHGLNQETYTTLKAFKDEGLTTKLGVSAYNPEEVMKVNEQFPIDIVQIPANIVDHRFLHPEFLEYCRANEIEIHARSLFLQGLLLLEPSNYPDYFKTISPQIESLNQQCEERGVGLMTACLSLLKSHYDIAFGVVGVTSRGQLLEICAAYDESVSLELEELLVNDEQYYNPALWPKEMEL